MHGNESKGTGCYQGSVCPTSCGFPLDPRCAKSAFGDDQLHRFSLSLLSVVCLGAFTIPAGLGQQSSFKKADAKPYPCQTEWTAPPLNEDTEHRKHVAGERVRDVHRAGASAYTRG
jgi:hypothetical protein